MASSLVAMSTCTLTAMIYFDTFPTMLIAVFGSGAQHSGCVSTDVYAIHAVPRVLVRDPRVVTICLCAPEGPSPPFNAPNTTLR